MSWLRLDGIAAGVPRTITDANGRPVEVQVDCVPTVPDVPVCCLAQDLIRNGTKTVRYRDLKIEAVPTWLHVRRQRYKCGTCGKTLYQIVPHVDDDHMVTTRVREAVEVSSVKRTFRDAATVHGVEETLARRIFRKHADRVLLGYRFKAPRVLGIDENSLLGALRGVLVDVEEGRLLDIYEGYNQSAIRRGFERMEDRHNVEVWCQDMSRTFKGLATDLFPKAAIVVDKFHVLRQANHWWSKVRLSETVKLPAEVRKGIPGLIRTFDKHWEALDERQQDRVSEVLSHSRRMANAYAIKDSFYYWYGAPTRADAEAAYKDWIAFVRSKDQMTEWKPLMLMVQRWRSEIFNHFDHPWTSGAVERMNRSIGEINRAASGMDFVTLRAKAILRYSGLVEEWRLNLGFMEFDLLADGVSELLAPYLESDAHLDDPPPDDRYFVGRGFDPSTLIADLKAGSFL